MRIMSILSILCAGSLLSYRYRRRMEETLPAMICITLPVLFLLAAFRLLWLVDILALLFVLTFLGMVGGALWRKKTSVHALWHFAKSFLLTPGLVAAFLTGILLWYLTSARFVYYSDDLNYWAVQTKSLWYSDGLLDAAHHCALRYSSYTPGTPLMMWWYMNIAGEWLENVLYFGLFYTNALLLLPFMRNSSFRKWYAIPIFILAALAGPTALSAFPYWLLSSDASLGFLLGYVLCQLYRSKSEDGFPLLCAKAGLCCLVLAKQIGLFWMFTALLYFLFICRSPQKDMLKRTWTFPFILPCLLVGFWFLFCYINDLGNYLTEGGASILSAIFQGAYQRPGGEGLILRHTLRAFLLSPVNQGGGWGGDAFIGLPMAGWILLFAISPVFCRCLLGYRGRKLLPAFHEGLLILSVSGVFLLIFFLGFFTLFSHEVPYWSQNPQEVSRLLWRYGSALLLGYGILWLERLLSTCRQLYAQGVKLYAQSIQALLLSLLLLSGNWPMLSYMWPSHFRSTFQEDSPYAKMRQDTSWFHAIAPEALPETRFLIASKYPTFHEAYAFVPASVVELPEGLLQHSTPATAFTHFVQKHHITHVVAQMDGNTTYRFLTEALGFSPQVGQLYAVNKSCEPYTLYPILHGSKTH